MASAQIERPRHIPSLDGLRAISIVLVILLHTLQRYAFTHPDQPTIFYVLANGTLGVFVFFVISGYLITSLLLKEQAKTGGVNLKSFYIRRGFRILPPLYVYIGAMLLLGWSGRLAGMNWREVWTAVTFTRNYAPGVGLWVFEHFWSLCVEEQFYLLWPGLVVFCLLKWPGVEGRWKAARVALVVIALEPFVRLASFKFLPVFWHNTGMFHMLPDGLMFGAVGALLQGDERLERIYRRVTQWPWALPLVLFLGLGWLGMKYQNYWNSPIGITLDGAVILMWMLWLIRNPETLQGRFMNAPLVTWIGRLSYSLYIWQTFFLHDSNVTVAGGYAWWNTWPGSWGCILVAAVVSFYVIEQPSLRLRDVMLRRIRWHEK